MKNEEIIGDVLLLIGVVLIAPYVINTVQNVFILGHNFVDRIAYENRMKKGLKDGSIIKINGEYYSVGTK